MMHYKSKLFTKSKETRSADGLKSKVYWSCSKRGCRGAVYYAHTIDPDASDHEGVYSDIVEKDHNDLCTTTAVDIIHRIARTEIISQAATGASLGAVRAAVLDPLLLLHPVAGQTMPAAASLQSSYSRAARASLPPVPPPGLMTQPFPVQFQTTNAGEPFLMFQENFSSDDSNDCTILIFCTMPFFRTFCEASTIFIDGTFTTCPLGFSKFLSFLTVHGSSSRFIPAMYCLLAGSSTEFYQRIFSLIKSKAEELDIPMQWNTVVADYDDSMIEAIQSSFPAVAVQGSHFHFTSAVYKVAYSLLNVRTLCYIIILCVKCCVVYYFILFHYIVLCCVVLC
jgi:MULE transposase domain